MDHMTFDPGQLISRKSSTPSVVSNANGTPSPVVGEGSLSLSTSLHLDSERRLIVVLDGANSTTWTEHWIVRSRLVKLSQPVELVLRGRETKFASNLELAKSHRVLFPLSSNKSLIQFSVVHSDVWGPAKIATPGGARCFIKWWRLSFMPEFKFFVLTMGKNFSTMILTSSYKIMASYINTHALTLPNIMGWLKERTNTYWKSFVPLSLVPICHDPFGAKPSSLQHTLSTGFPLEEEIKPVYEILPASAPVPHQSHVEEFIQKAHSLHISFQRGRTVANLKYNMKQILKSKGNTSQQIIRVTCALCEAVG
ncbi:unnamed protein product [Prunus armeniaca]